MGMDGWRGWFEFQISDLRLQMKNGWYKILNVANDTAEVMIYGIIGTFFDGDGNNAGISAEDFRKEFNAIQAPKINLRINSDGGEIFEAAAICTAIREHPAMVKACVDGIAASSACTVAIACDEVTIGKNAWMMIHNAASFCFGGAEQMRASAARLDQMNHATAKAICDKTGKSEKDVLAAMAAETWFDADSALAFGLADAIGDEAMPAEAPAMAQAGQKFFNLAKFHNVPEKVRTAVASCQKTHGGIVASC
jgi:ATP-dependent protease ClpP protease subunit